MEDYACGIIPWARDRSECGAGDGNGEPCEMPGFDPPLPTTWFKGVHRQSRVEPVQNLDGPLMVKRSIYNSRAGTAISTPIRSSSSSLLQPHIPHGRRIN